MKVRVTHNHCSVLAGTIEGRRYYATVPDLGNRPEIAGTHILADA